MTSTIYVIDACALIDAHKLYSRKVRMFDPLWDKISDMFTSGSLISSSEIFEEIKDIDLALWLKPYKSSFLTISKEIQENVSRLLKEYPNLINMRKGKKGSSSGDPFLIATAQHFSGVVVTNEHPAGLTSSYAKIPDVCQKIGMQVINFTRFIEIVMQ